MSEIKELLLQAEKNLQEANSNLQKLESMNISSLFEGDLELLLEKYAQTNLLIKKKKEELLRLLVKAVLITGHTKYTIMVGPCNDYSITSSTIIISGGDNRSCYKDVRGTYSFQEFLFDSEIGSGIKDDFFEMMLNTIIKFVKESPETQSKEIQKINKLLTKLQALTISVS